MSSLRGAEGLWGSEGCDGDNDGGVGAVRAVREDSEGADDDLVIPTFTPANFHCANFCLVNRITDLWQPSVLDDVAC